MTQILLYWWMFCTHQVFWKLFLGNWLETKNEQILAKLQLLQFHKNSKFQKNDQSQSPKSDLNSPENEEPALKKNCWLGSMNIWFWNAPFSGDIPSFSALCIDPKAWIDHDNAARQLPSGSVFGVVKKVGTSTKVIFSFMWPLVTALGSWTCIRNGAVGEVLFLLFHPPKKARIFWILWECIFFLELFLIFLYFGGCWFWVSGLGFSPNKSFSRLPQIIQWVGTLAEKPRMLAFVTSQDEKHHPGNRLSSLHPERFELVPWKVAFLGELSLYSW